MSQTTDTNLVWIDVEGTGIDLSQVHILEISLLITDKDLNPLNAGLDLTVHQSGEVLDSMNDWCKENHGKSGLIDLVKNSKLDYLSIQEILLTEIKKYVSEKSSPLCGNSVFYDKTLLGKYLPEVLNFLHYRIIDVSSIKELYRRWYPQLPEFAKKKGHRALDDIYESLAELKYYRQTIFKSLL